MSVTHEPDNERPVESVVGQRKRPSVEEVNTKVALPAYKYSGAVFKPEPKVIVTSRKASVVIEATVSATSE